MTKLNHAKCWLGREDSNLRMPVPKTGRNVPFRRHSLRNSAFLHNAVLRVCAPFAEGNRA